MNTLGVLDKVEIEMDSGSCTYWKGRYNQSWIEEVLNIGEESERIGYYYFLRAVGKPYFHRLGSFYLTSSTNIVTYNQVWDNKRGTLCLESVPDTGLTRVDVPDAFLHSLQPNFIPMSMEEALAIARNTLQLDTHHRCIRATPVREQLSMSGKNTSNFWYLSIELQPSDTIVYYQMKENSKLSDEEIKDFLNKRRKWDGDCRCPEFVIRCEVDVQVKKVTLAILDSRWLNDVIGWAPNHLSALEDEMYKKLRAWRAQNGDTLRGK
ncbi:MAG: hypothetical protein ACOVSW_10690 [Candidatus Kapaibacteriota bacterium]